LNAARSIIWLTNGATKAEPLQQLLRGDTEIPAGRVEQTHAAVFCDEAAATPTTSAE
jgi:6-phosphogluconolactonase/glucosamine-6-phosphate isomerase/deaminase